MMNNGRERLGSRLGFILLSAGCAIGCGNVWKFPWMTGQSGGGGFVLVYVLCLLLLGLPAMIMEFSVGRAAQASPVRMYQKLEKKGQKWHLHGYLALAGNLALMAFYTVVTGWMIYYFVRFLTGKTEGLGFGAMIGDPAVNVIYLFIAVALGFGVLSIGIQKGLERVTKYMMLLLFLLMLVLVLHSAFLPGAEEGLRFYLVPL
jgi:NSS family neurotransmitter:Na+ symporter